MRINLQFTVAIEGGLYISRGGAIMFGQEPTVRPVFARGLGRMNSGVLIASMRRFEASYACLSADRWGMFLFCNVLPVGYDKPCRILSR